MGWIMMDWEEIYLRFTGLQSRAVSLCWEHPGLVNMKISD